MKTHRRHFLQGLAAGTAVAGPLWAQPATKPTYRGPNVILIRFGGGARRRESIDPQHSYARHLTQELAPRGTLFGNMIVDLVEFKARSGEKLDSKLNVDTSHAQGTLYLLLGKYEKFRDRDGKFLSENFELKVPTLFEYFRSAFDVPPEQTLIINNENRPQEEYFTFSNHIHFGVDYKAETLSLFRFKLHLYSQQLKDPKLPEAERRRVAKLMRDLEKSLNQEQKNADRQGPAIRDFWNGWRAYYGDGGFVNERGDQLLTDLSLRAMQHLRPRLMMINYTDCDYVHWGVRSHYTDAIRIMDRGIRQLVQFVDHDEFYRGNTVFCIVPDCGRDNNPLADVPFQHHFNSRSSREIFALLFGPGVPKGTRVDKPVHQIQVAATIGQLMGFKTPHTEGPVLEAALA